MFCICKEIGKIFTAGAVFLSLLAPSFTQAGSSPVVTVSDSSSGGAVNFQPPVGDSGVETGFDAGDIASGGTPSVEIAPGVSVTVASIETAVNNGSLGRDQVLNGFGDGGTAVTLAPESTENVQRAASTPSVLVDGENMSPLDALLALSTSQELDRVRVTMPSGAVIGLSSSASNVTAALTSGDSTYIGTALNDAAIAFSTAIRNGETAPDLKSSSDAVADLLDAVRAVPQVSLSN